MIPQNQIRHIGTQPQQVPITNNNRPSSVSGPNMPNSTQMQNNNNTATQHKHRHKHNTKSILNPSYIGVILAILLVSFVFIYQFLIRAKPSFWIPILIIFCILLFMVEWSFFATSCTDPGKVPLYYGMSSQLTNTARKYCLLCHNFKPQRTHHCSMCKKCILHMDHHCPWINNCVGFRNRKFFILFLFYITIGLIFMSIIQLIVLISQIKKVIQTKSTDIHFAIKILQFLFTTGFSFALFAFLIYHLKMVTRNTSTLEQLGRKRFSNEQKPVQFDQSNIDYDVGMQQNLQQVFGEDKLMWPFPFYGKGPKGNGTSWPKNIGNSFYNSPTRQYEQDPLRSGKMRNF